MGKVIEKIINGEEDAKEVLLKALADIFNEEEYPEYREERIFQAMIESGLFEQEIKNTIKYIG